MFHLPNFLKQRDGTIHPLVKTAGVGTGVGSAIAIALTLIMPWEGFAPKPEVDRIGTGHPVTWCFGATKADRPVPPLNSVFTKEECTKELQEDLTNKYDPEVKKCIHVPLPPHREAALISFVYNLGPAALCNGPVGRDLNAGNVTAACNAMLAYDHAGGKYIQGLANRRKAERELCLRND